MTNMDELSKKSVWEKYSDKLVSKIFSPYFDDMKSENLYVYYNSYFEEYPKFDYKPTSEDIELAKNLFKKNINTNYFKENIYNVGKFTCNNLAFIKFYLSISNNEKVDNCIYSIRLNIEKEDNIEYDYFKNTGKILLLCAYGSIISSITLKEKDKEKFIKEEFENKLHDIIKFNDAFSDDIYTIDTFDQLYCRVLTEDNDKFVFIPILYCDGDSCVLDICIDIKDKDGKFYDYYA